MFFYVYIFIRMYYFNFSTSVINLYIYIVKLVLFIYMSYVKHHNTIDMALHNIKTIIVGPWHICLDIG